MLLLNCFKANLCFCVELTTSQVAFISQSGRVWIITKVPLSKYSDMEFAFFNFEPSCVSSLTHPNVSKFRYGSLRHWLETNDNFTSAERAAL